MSNHLVFGSPLADVVLRQRAIDFLRGKIPDHNGLKVDQYFYMNETDMENFHDWVQWAFPIDTVSQHNNQCGNISRSDPIVLRAFKYGTKVYGNHLVLVQQYLATVGIDLYAGTNINKFFQVVDSPYNHHMKRLSRVMLSLMITGNKMDARQLYKTLINDLVMRDPPAFQQKTIAYWGSIVLEFDDITREKL